MKAKQRERRRQAKWPSQMATTNCKRIICWEPENETGTDYVIIINYCVAWCKTGERTTNTRKQTEKIYWRPTQQMVKIKMIITLAMTTIKYNCWLFYYIVVKICFTLGRNISLRFHIFLFRSLLKTKTIFLRWTKKKNRMKNGQPRWAMAKLIVHSAVKWSLFKMIMPSVSLRSSSQKNILTWIPVKIYDYTFCFIFNIATVNAQHHNKPVDWNPFCYMHASHFFIHFTSDTQTQSHTHTHSGHTSFFVKKMFPRKTI